MCRPLQKPLEGVSGLRTDETPKPRRHFHRHRRTILAFLKYYGNTHFDMQKQCTSRLISQAFPNVREFHTAEVEVEIYAREK